MPEPKKTYADASTQGKAMALIDEKLVVVDEAVLATLAANAMRLASHPHA